MWDIWNINNAFDGEEENTSYRPLIKHLSGQPIEGLLTLLEARDPKRFRPLIPLRETIQRWHDLPNELRLKEFDELKQESEGFAQFFTGYLLPKEQLREIHDLEAHLINYREAFGSALLAQRRML